MGEPSEEGLDRALGLVGAVSVEDKGTLEGPRAPEQHAQSGRGGKRRLGPGGALRGPGTAVSGGIEASGPGS